MPYAKRFVLPEFDLEEEALRSAHMDMMIERMASELGRSIPQYK